MATQCGVCNETYSATNDAQKPRFLDCGHTWCTHCISTLPRSRALVECPTCRKKTSLAKGVDSRPINFIALELIEVKEAAVSPSADSRSGRGASKRKRATSTAEAHAVLCAVCGEEAATLYCSSCTAQEYCDACSQFAHKGVKSSHVRVDISKRPEPLQCCKDHPKHPLTLFCDLDQELICDRCGALGSHSGHAIRTLADVAKEHDAILRAKLPVLGTKAEDLKRSLSWVHDTVSRVTLQQEHVVGTLDAERQQLITLVQDVCTKRRAEISEYQCSTLALLQDLKQAATTAVTGIDTARSQIGVALSIAEKGSEQKFVGSVKSTLAATQSACDLSDWVKASVPVTHPSPSAFAAAFQSNAPPLIEMARSALVPLPTAPAGSAVVLYQTLALAARDSCSDALFNTLLQNMGLLCFSRSDIFLQALSKRDSPLSLCKFDVEAVILSRVSDVACLRAARCLNPEYLKVPAAPQLQLQAKGALWFLFLCLWSRPKHCSWFCGAPADSVLSLLRHEAKLCSDIVDLGIAVLCAAGLRSQDSQYRSWFAQSNRLHGLLSALLSSNVSACGRFLGVDLCYQFCNDSLANSSMFVKASGVDTLMAILTVRPGEVTVALRAAAALVCLSSTEVSCLQTTGAASVVLALYSQIVDDLDSVGRLREIVDQLNCQVFSPPFNMMDPPRRITLICILREMQADPERCIRACQYLESLVCLNRSLSDAAESLGVYGVLSKVLRTMPVHPAEDDQFAALCSTTSTLWRSRSEHQLVSPQLTECIKVLIARMEPSAPIGTVASRCQEVVATLAVLTTTASLRSVLLSLDSVSSATVSSRLAELSTQDAPEHNANLFVLLPFFQSKRTRWG